MYELLRVLNETSVHVDEGFEVDGLFQLVPARRITGLLHGCLVEVDDKALDLVQNAPILRAEVLEPQNVFDVPFLGTIADSEVFGLPFENIRKERVKCLLDKRDHETQDLPFPVQLSSVLLVDLELGNELLQSVVDQLEEYVVVLVVDGCNLYGDLKEVPLNRLQFLLHLPTVELN